MLATSATRAATSLPALARSLRKLHKGGGVGSRTIITRAGDTVREGGAELPNAKLPAKLHCYCWNRVFLPRVVNALPLLSPSLSLFSFSRRRFWLCAPVSHQLDPSFRAPPPASGVVS